MRKQDCNSRALLSLWSCCELRSSHKNSKKSKSNTSSKSNSSFSKIPVGSHDIAPCNPTRT